MEQLRQAAGNGPQARKLLDTLFRSVHNLKASASTNGLTNLAAAAHEFENVLHALRKQPLAEGARLFLVQTDLDVNDFDREFQSLKETLSKTGEVISTEPSVNKDRPGKVNFRILYASNQTPDIPAVIVEEISADAPTTTNTFEHQIPVLESAFEKFAAELRTISVDDPLAQALRAGEAAAQVTGKHVDFEVRGDASLLTQQIADPLLHLVRNAVDHGIETRGKVTIEIAQRDDRISITVTDDGRGIDPSVIDRIFQPGFSTASEVSELSGRGVGLDVVKTTVEELGGAINVRSTPGQGASFEITLPIRSA
jgi:chemotaxis protein histidine kinase CheA